MFFLDKCFTPHWWSDKSRKSFVGFGKTRHKDILLTNPDMKDLLWTDDEATLAKDYSNTSTNTSNRGRSRRAARCRSGDAGDTGAGGAGGAGRVGRVGGVGASGTGGSSAGGSSTGGSGTGGAGGAGRAGSRSRSRSRSRRSQSPSSSTTSSTTTTNSIRTSTPFKMRLSGIHPTTLQSNPIRDDYATAAPFKIFVYQMPTSFNVEIRRENRNCASSMFASEVALHTWLLQNKGIRTLDPHEASLFYVPAYTTCRSTAFAGNGPDPWAGKDLMSRAINWVVKNHPDRWLKKQGRDHVFTAVHDYASCFDFQRKRANKMGPLSELSNSIVLMSLGDTKSKCYNPLKDVTIPTFIPTVPTTHVHRPNSDLLMQANWKMYLGNQGPEDEDAKKTTASSDWFFQHIVQTKRRAVGQHSRVAQLFVVCACMCSWHRNTDLTRPNDNVQSASTHC